MFSKGNDFVKLRRYGPQKRLPSCQAHQHGIGPFIFPEQVCERHRIKELYVSFCPGNQFRQVLLFGSSTDQLKFNIHSACLRNLCCLYRYFEILAAADRARIQNTETVAVILRLLKFFKLVWIYSVSNHLGPSDAATCDYVSKTSGGGYDKGGAALHERDHPCCAMSDGARGKAGFLQHVAAINKIRPGVPHFRHMGNPQKRRK